MYIFIQKFSSVLLLLVTSYFYNYNEDNFHIKFVIQNYMRYYQIKEMSSSLVLLLYEQG